MCSYVLMTGFSDTSPEMRIAEIKQQAYSRNTHNRACPHWWFGGWDWLVNSTLKLAGSTNIRTRPGEIAFDPHVHTLYSHCSISTPAKLIKKAVRVGLGAIAVMDHDTIEGALDTMRCAEYLKSRGEIPEDFLVVPGVEVNTTHGHVGALFVQQDLAAGSTPAELIDEIHELGGLAVVVHPYHSTGIGDVLFELDLDAVEVECGSVFSSDIALSNRGLLADENLSNVAKLGSSDAHYVAAVGSCYTIVRGIGEPTLESLKQAMIAGNCEPVSSLPYRNVANFLGKIGKLR